MTGKHVSIAAIYFWILMLLEHLHRCGLSKVTRTFKPGVHHSLVWKKSAPSDQIRKKCFLFPPRYKSGQNLCAAYHQPWTSSFKTFSLVAISISQLLYLAVVASTMNYRYMVIRFWRGQQIPSEEDIAGLFQTENQPVFIVWLTLVSMHVRGMRRLSSGLSKPLRCKVNRRTTDSICWGIGTRWQGGNDCAQYG